jgi:DNA-binding winged helix-turn-helix (wHTH) protein/tetratricopeptide (TPR) repeat protein
MTDRCVYEFGRYRLDPAEHLLLCDCTPLPVTGKAFQVLLVLVQNAGHLVERSDLVTAVWGDTFVEEGNLSVTISALRKVLGDDRHQNRFIETIAKQGYRFLPAVTREQVELHKEKAAFEEPKPAPIESSDQAPSISNFSFAVIRQSLLKKYVAYAVAVSLLTVLAAATLQVRSRVKPSKRTDQNIHSIAIAPFDATGSDANSLRIGTGLADELISKFGEADQVEVRPANAVMQYGGKDETPASIASEQKVDAVLTGTVVTKNEQVHVAATLFSSTGTVLWTGNFDESLPQIASLENKIESEVSNSIFPERAAIQIEKKAGNDPEAYQLYVEGRFFWNKRTEKGFRRSIECFQQAVLKDPTYADAYAGLADSYTLLASYGVEPAQEAYPNAKAAATKALQLDDHLAEAHTSLGMVALYYEWNWPEADREFRRAIELNPNYPLAHTWDALYFSAMDQRPEALQQALRSQQLDPLSLMTNTELGRVYYWSRQYDKAIVNYRHAIELDPYFARAHTRLGMAYAAQKDYADAIHEFQEASKLSSPDPYIDGLTGYAEAMSGDTKGARQILVSLTGRAQHDYVPAFSIALLCIGLGEHAQAMNWLEQAYEDRSTYMVYAKVDPLLDPIRSDERFVALMKRMDLQEFRGSDTIRASSSLVKTELMGKS